MRPHPTHRSTLRRLAVIAGAAALAACAETPAPTEPLAPSEPALAKVVLTHPAGSLAERVPVASLPWGIAVSPKGDVLTVLPYLNAVQGFSLADPTAVRQPLNVTAYPLDVIYNRNGSLAYVSGKDGGSVDIIDVRSNSVQGSIPLGTDVYRLALSKDESRIYATTLFGRLWTARTHGDPRAAYVDLDYSSIQGKSLSPSGSDLYVASTGGKVWRLDPVTLVVRQSVTLPGRIQDIAVTPDGSALWAADEGGKLWRLDPVTLATVTTIDLSVSGGYPFGLAISPDGARIYAITSYTGMLHIVQETAPGTYSVTPVTIGGTPRRVAFGLNGAAAVVSNEWSWVDVIR